MAVCVTLALVGHCGVNDKRNAGVLWRSSEEFLLPSCVPVAECLHHGRLMSISHKKAFMLGGEPSCVQVVLRVFA